MRIPTSILLIAVACANAIAADPSGTYPKTIDLNDQVHRQVLVDREAGQYLGHPTTCLLEDGKTIVLITSSIHSTEVGGHLSPTIIAHRLATENTPETMSILDNTVLLLVPSLNPDGVTIVSNWYNRTLGTSAEGSGVHRHRGVHVRVAPVDARGETNGAGCDRLPRKQR